MNIIKQIDIFLFWLINSHHTPVLDIFFGTITCLGNGWVVTPILLGIMVLKMPRRFWLNTVLCGTLALSLSGLLNTWIKQTVDRPRPLAFFETVSSSSGSNAHCAVPEDENIPRVHVIGPGLRQHSFPSGHTNTAFGAAVLLGLLFGGWFWSSLIVAALVAYSRVYSGVHFPLDLAGGAMLGTVITVLVALFFFRKKWLQSPGKDV
jgi:membrane-associated phospholipid phosphatase